MKVAQTLAASLLAAAVAAVIAAPASADLIQLKDGRTFNGSINRDGDNMVIRPDPPADGSEAKPVTVPADQVTHITLTTTVTPAQAAETDWNRAAGLIKKADDLASIISLHEKFLDKYPDQPISLSVRTSLGEYEKLQLQKAVKFRGRWMPAAQVDVQIRTWKEEAKPALDLYRAGRVREAFESAKLIVQTDDENPDAATIAGLSAFRINNLTASRQYFTKLSAADPSSCLAENNLGVICAQQRAFAEALLHYAKALQIAPGNRLLLDNIEEAFAAYTGNDGDKNNAAYTDLQRQFAQAEVRVEAEMAQKNLYRFGSTWVSKEQLTQLTTSREAIQASMKDIDARYNAARQSFTAINQQINQLAGDYTAGLNNINSLNGIINGVQNGSDISAMIAQRDAAVADLEKIRTQKTALEQQRDKITLSFTDIFSEADKLKVALANADGAQFTGIQRMMEIGEDLIPPPPAPLPVPPRHAPAPVAVVQNPAPAPAPVPTQEVYENNVVQNYQVIATPIGIPVPIHPPHHDHDHHDDHPTTNPSPTPTPTPPIITPPKRPETVVRNSGNPASPGNEASAPATPPSPPPAPVVAPAPPPPAPVIAPAPPSSSNNDKQGDSNSNVKRPM